MSDEGKLFTTKDIVVLALFQAHTDFEDLGSGSGEPIRKPDEYTGQTKDELTKHLIGVSSIDSDHNVNVKKQKICDELATEALFRQFPWLAEVDKSFQNSGCTPYVKNSEEKQDLVNWVNDIVSKHGSWQVVQPSGNAFMNSYIESVVEENEISYTDFSLN